MRQPYDTDTDTQQKLTRNNIILIFFSVSPVIRARTHQKYANAQQNVVLCFVYRESVCLCVCATYVLSHNYMTKNNIFA